MLEQVQDLAAVVAAASLTGKQAPSEPALAASGDRIGVSVPSETQNTTSSEEPGKGDATQDPGSREHAETTGEDGGASDVAHAVDGDEKWQDVAEAKGAVSEELLQGVQGTGDAAVQSDQKTFVAAMLQAIQGSQGTIRDLEQRITELNGHVASLEAAVAECDGAVGGMGVALDGAASVMEALVARLADACAWRAGEDRRAGDQVAEALLQQLQVCVSAFARENLMHVWLYPSFFNFGHIEPDCCMHMQLSSSLLAAFDAVKHKGLPPSEAEAFARQLHLGIGEKPPPLPLHAQTAATAVHGAHTQGTAADGDGQNVPSEAAPSLAEELSPPGGELGMEAPDGQAAPSARDVQGGGAQPAPEPSAEAWAIRSRYARISAEPEIKDLALRVAGMSRETACTLMRQHTHVEELKAAVHTLGAEVLACARDLGQVRHALANLELSQASAERDKAQSQVCVCVCVCERAKVTCSCRDYLLAHLRLCRTFHREPCFAACARILRGA